MDRDAEVGHSVINCKGTHTFACAGIGRQQNFIIQMKRIQKNLSMINMNQITWGFGASIAQAAFVHRRAILTLTLTVTATILPAYFPEVIP